MVNAVAIQQATENRRKLVENLYSKYSIGKEYQVSVHDLAENFDIPYGSATKSMMALEKSGAITRRIDYGHGNKAGRRGFMTLNVPKEEAIDLVSDDLPDSERESLKQRILLALSISDKPLSSRELSYAIHLNNNGGSSDLHNLTHLLHALKRQGKVTFHTDSTNDKVPYDIRLISKPKEVEKSSQVQTITAEQTITPEAAVSEATTDVVVEDEEEPEVTVNYFPLAAKLSARKEMLEKVTDLAKIAENAGEEDIAIALMESVDKPFSAIEQEHINLYRAFMDCVKS